MGKKYLETKNKSLESSILGVWKTAVEEGAGRMDGRTSEYRNHRKKLESARQRREEKKVTTEEVDLNELPEMSDEEFNTFLETLTDEELITLNDLSKSPSLDEGILGAIGRQVQKRTGLGPGGKQARAKHLKTKADKQTAKTTAVKDIDKHKATIATQKKARKDYKAQKKYVPTKDEFNPALDEKNTHVNPKDREELDKAPSDTAKKMKRAQEPVPNQMAEAQSGDKEAYKKFFDSALKKFKVSSPADLKGDDKKKFYDYVDKNWEGDNEKAEGAMSQVREFKVQSMKAALAKVWGLDEHKGTKPHKHPHEDNEVEEGLENSSNPANKQHLCAKNVVHEEWGDGQCIATQHADPDEEGNVAWYDVMFEHGIEKGVLITELKVTKSEDHMHASYNGKKKKKEQVSKTETGKKAAAIDLKPTIDDT